MSQELSFFRATPIFLALRGVAGLKAEAPASVFHAKMLPVV
jgi:hypothetical protein